MQNLFKMFKNFQHNITSNTKNLIETKDLANMLKDENLKSSLRILDCTWLLSPETKSAKQLFEEERIPMSIYYDVDEICDKNTILPHMMADENTFRKYMKKMDIRKSDYIICYDKCGMFSAPRVWFNFQIFGHKNVAVLNGGYPKWAKENLPIETDENSEIIKRGQPKDDDFDYLLDKSKLRDIKSILDLSKSVCNKDTNEQIIDARPAPRFNSEVDEPRPSKRRGHIDGAINVPFKNLLDEQSCFKSEEDIKQEFEKQGVNIDNPLTLYCGSGMTACVDLFALALLGKLDNCKLYDGSWSEMGNIDEKELEQLKKTSSSL